jgi:glycosyltransferase involved in cell wall biosynthesis
MRLLVVTSVIHYEWNRRLSAFAGYAREMDIWADLFSEVGIAAPARHQPAPGDCAPFARQNIHILPQKEVGGANFRAKANLLVNVPALISSLVNLVRHYDAVHVRCPGNLGFLGIFLAPLFSRRIIAKYAGQWNSYPGEDLTTRLQRRLLKSRFWTGPVTVYGQWPKQQAHIVPFFTSVMTGERLHRAADAACQERNPALLRVLFVGRLSAGKNIDILIEALASLHAQQIAFLCSIIGEGPELGRLQALANELGISDFIRFTGGLDHDHVLEQMERSDVLVLASNSEGWPKAIAEGMAHGLVCIGSDRGLIPEMLAEGRGVIVPPRDSGALARALTRVAADPQGFEVMRRRAAAWASQYSIEGLRDALAALLQTHWKLPPNDVSIHYEPAWQEVT